MSDLMSGQQQGNLGGLDTSSEGGGSYQDLLPLLMGQGNQQNPLSLINTLNSLQTNALVPQINTNLNSLTSQLQQALQSGGGGGSGIGSIIGGVLGIAGSIFGF